MHRLSSTLPRELHIEASICLQLHNQIPLIIRSICINVEKAVYTAINCVAILAKILLCYLILKIVKAVN